MASRTVSEHPAWPARVRLGLARYESSDRLPLPWPAVGPAANQNFRSMAAEVIDASRLTRFAPPPTLAKTVACDEPGGGSMARGRRQWARLGPREGGVVAW
jgi:hypothetical protein